MPTAAVGMFFRENSSMATLRSHGTRYTGTETALTLPAILINRQRQATFGRPISFGV
jgi:hypothetical protein